MTTDRELGMGRRISRRDFLQASALGAGAFVGTPSARASASAYPPELTGLRGSHDGSFEAAHALAREGRTDWGHSADTKEHYDLVVVGAGVSGLSAAYFYRQQHPSARILILDNHDDFGGHAKRNEFTVGARQLIGYGGSQSLEAPSDYSAVATKLLQELSISTDRFYDEYDQGFNQRHDLTSGIYFDAATYGRNAWVLASDLTAFLTPAENHPTLSDAIKKMPLATATRAEFSALVDTREDKLANVGLSEVVDYLASRTYEQFLSKDVGVRSTQLLDLLRRLTTGYFGYGTDVTPAIQALAFGLPGLNKTGVWGAEWLARQLAANAEPYIFHFPDGNASVARALVRSLVPELGSAAEPAKLLLRRFDYRLLDQAAHNTRIRLSSTVLNVHDEGEKVRTSYYKHGQLHGVTADKVVLACYNMMIPHICPQLPAAQKAALSELVKIPLVYTNVALSNWRAIKTQHMGFAYTPSSFHAYCMVDFPVSMGDYQFASSPDDPILLHCSEALIQPGLPPKEQSRVGRARLLATSFEDIERDLRTTLNGILSPAGFDAARDIAAITVNRWPHGYAYEYNSVFDPDYGPGEAPHEIGRATFGNIAIANSDAGARAYLDEAINQAHRAVGELM